MYVCTILRYKFEEQFRHIHIMNALLMESDVCCVVSECRSCALLITVTDSTEDAVLV